MKRLRAAFEAYSNELIHKVTWPSVAELQSSTVVVLIGSIILAIIIGLMDLVFKWVMGGLYTL